MERNLALFLCLCLAGPTLAQDGNSNAEYFEKLGSLFRQNVEQASPAIVNIRVTRNYRPVARVLIGGNSADESGSGIIATIADEQVILTNRHVIAHVERSAIEILTHDRRILTVRNVISNEEFDIAVIEVEEELHNPARFGNSDLVHTGDIVLAIGNPFGLERSVSMGVVSAVGRRHVPGANNAAPRVDFFQTDAAVNPGSSGGMLLNLRGEVIGILTAIATQGGRHEGVAFVMPINPVVQVAEQLVQTGTVLKAHIGCNFDAAIAPDRRRTLGIDRLVGSQVNRVDADTPAAQSGLQVGDVVLMYNDIEVEDRQHIFHLLRQSEIGKPIVLQINRDGETFDITVTPIAELSR
ncbi:MAG: trypsin-like peptidase domain-containing protein [Planctomycetaceae bacterium]|nr:trypsin-like peptidase domain-containing protein [Planctomycetaceae bacterium]